MRHTTRRTVLGALAALSLTARRAVAAPPSFSGGNGPDPQAAAWSRLSLVGEDGIVFSLSDLRKPSCFVNLWANWCPGCLSEMGSIARMQAALGEHTVDVLLVSHPSNWQADKEFARNRGFSFRLCSFAPGTRDETIAAAYNSVPGASYSVPQSLLFSGPGHALAWVEEGAREWDSQNSLARLQSTAI